MLPKAHLTSHSSMFHVVSHWHNQIHRKLWTCVSEAATIRRQCRCQKTWGPKSSLNIENTYICLKTGVYSLKWSQVTPESQVTELLGWRCGWNWGSHNLRPSPCVEGGPAPRTRRTGPSGVSQSSREAGTLVQAANIHPGDFPGKSTGVGCHCLLCPRREKNLISQMFCLLHSPVSLLIQK